MLTTFKSTEGGMKMHNPLECERLESHENPCPNRDLSGIRNLIDFLALLAVSGNYKISYPASIFDEASRICTQCSSYVQEK